MLGLRSGKATTLVALVCAVMASGSISATAETKVSQRSGPEGCVTETGSSGACLDGRGLVGAAAVSLSPDGGNAYVASASWDSVSILSRDSGGGSLAPISASTGCFDSLPGIYPDCTPMGGLAGAHDVAVSPDGRNVYVAAPGDSAVVTFGRAGATGLLTPQGCVNQAGSGGCADGRALDGATSVVLDANGSNAYVASSGLNGGIAIFDRDPETGVLTLKNGGAGCINEDGAEACSDGLDQMLDLRDVELSPDGMSAYAVARSGEAITAYSRELSTGELTPMPAPTGCVNESGSGGCQNGKALMRAESVTVSPDGGTVYVAGERSDSIAVFDRNPTGGQLLQKSGVAGCVSDTGLSDPMQASTAGDCTQGMAMDGIDSIAILPDGSALFAAARESSGLAIFDRHADGTLTQRPGTEGCITETGREDPDLSFTAGNCDDGRALLGISRVISSGDGRHLYTAAQNGGIGVFDILSPTNPDEGAGPAQEPPRPAPATAYDRKCRLLRADISRARRRLRTIAQEVRYLTHLPSLTGAKRRRLRQQRRLEGRWARHLRHSQKLKRESC